MSTTSRKASYRRMTAKEYNGAMESIALPAPEFAELIGVSWRQGERYRNGECGIPDAVAKLIRTILNNDLALERVG